LNYLNRDLSKVIAIDTLPEHLALNSENALIIPKWNGDKEGRAGLVNLIPLLECELRLLIVVLSANHTL
jgi:import inner membrane translocase subunit TIM50